MTTQKAAELDEAMRLVENHGGRGAERRATLRALEYRAGTPRREFWMHVAQIIADFRSDFDIDC